MIIDTSVLVRIFFREDGFEALLDTVLNERGFIPSPVIVEFGRVVARKGIAIETAKAFLDYLVPASVTAVPFETAAAIAGFQACYVHGSGMNNGGKLNLLDLMVYAEAKTRALPILCTGRDYPATDAVIHPSSQPE